MSSFTEPMIVEVLEKERDGEGVFRLHRSFTYEVGHLGSGEAIIVPAGFESDFCSVPRLARWLIPIAGRGAKAAVLHDYLLSCNDERANDVFSEALRVAGTPSWRRWLMVTFVRIWTV